MSTFPTIGANDLLRLLTKEPLNYHETRRSGSHRTLKAEGRPDLHFSFHDRATIGPTLLKKILTMDVGLPEDEALRLL